MRRHLIKKLYFKFFGSLHNVISGPNYMKHYIKYLRSLGIQIEGTPEYIAPNAYFDAHDYSAIHLGNGITVSREVMFLVHDYSIIQGLKSIGKREEFGLGGKNGTPHFKNYIFVEDNCFIGARASLLPGTHIGKNCIIGACSVVKGTIEQDSIVVGNPAKVIGRVSDWTQKHIERNDFLIIR